MKQKTSFLFSYVGTAGIEPLVLKERMMCSSLKTIAQQLHEAQQGYNSEYAFVHTVYDEFSLQAIEKLIAEKQKDDPALIVVVGIGGSSLGTKALYKALSFDVFQKLYFVETIDTAFMESTVALLYNLMLVKKRNALLVIVTKSGTTYETVANMDVLIAVFKTIYGNDASRYIVCITDKGSVLDMYAEKEQYAVLHIPKKVGGRFSVFTAVGLFPLGMVSIDIRKCIAGAKNQHKSCSVIDDTNYALVSALLLYKHYENGIRVHDTFLFSMALEDLGKWYRQLLGESIGKEYDIQGKRVSVGLMPTVSMGTNDLHSVLQMYLAGPSIAFTSFVAVQETNKNSDCEKQYAVSDKEQCLAIKKFNDVAIAFLQATQKTYKAYERPFCSFLFSEKNEYVLGEYMFLKMCEISYLAALFSVNPFDQPHVETYKKELVQLLKKEN